MSSFISLLVSMGIVSLMGLGILATLIWYYGPMLSFGDFAPLISLLLETLRSPLEIALVGEGEQPLEADLVIEARLAMDSVDELNAFTQDKSPDKKAKLVGKLLHDEDYIEEYARNWTTLWTNVLIGRSGGTERNTLTSREA